MYTTIRKQITQMTPQTTLRITVKEEEHLYARPPPSNKKMEYKNKILKKS